MDDITSPAGASVSRDNTQGRIGQRRVVPGPKSKAVFDREAERMAPGLQSIALYSQIVVDHARSCTIVDVDGNEYLDFIAGIAIGSVGHCHPHYVKRLNEQLGRFTLGSFATETRARFINLVSELLPEGITHIQLYSGGAEAVEAAFRLAKSVTKNSNLSGFGAAITARPLASSACSVAAIAIIRVRFLRGCICLLTPIVIAVPGSSSIRPADSRARSICATS